MKLDERIKLFAAKVKDDIRNVLNKIGDLTTLVTSKKTSLVEAINELATKVTDVGDLSTLTTSDKTSLVKAINELNSLATNASGIDDTAGDGVANKTWSADKIGDSILASVTALETKLTNGAGAALDTFKELADAINNNPNFASELATTMGNMVRVDVVQTFTQAQKKQACENIGIGDPDTDLVAYYNSL